MRIKNFNLKIQLKKLDTQNSMVIVFAFHILDLAKKKKVR